MVVFVVCVLLNRYNEKESLRLAMLVTKYIQRNGWSHVDVLRLSHVKPKNDSEYTKQSEITLAKYVSTPLITDALTGSS